MSRSSEANPEDSFSGTEMADRLARIRQEMAAQGLDVLISIDPATVRYATGFRGEPRTLFLTPENAVLYTSIRTLPWAERQTCALGSTIELVTSNQPLEVIRKRLPDTAQQIGIDTSIPHQTFLDWQSILAPHELQISGAIERARQIKSPAEIALMEASQRLTESVFQAILPRIQPGMTERGIQGLILAEMAANEAIDAYAFTPIVAVGPNCWEIHHLPDFTVVEQNDLLLIDLGVIHQGYASDMTRTICLGKATPEMRAVYETVGEAQQAAIAAMKPGACCQEIDQIARQIIAEAGYGETFTHGLGHSIGMEAHDPGPRLAPRETEAQLEPGMVFTVEPGIYLQNQFGVRTEDMVVVTSDGCTNLTVQPFLLLELSV